MTEGDPAFGQIVGGKFEGYFVACQNAYAVASKAACQMREDYFFMFQLDAEKPAGEFLQNRTGYFNAVFFTHSTSLPIV